VTHWQSFCRRSKPIGLRLFAVPAALSLIVGFAGCSSGGDDGGTTVTPEAGGHSYVVPDGFSIAESVNVSQTTGEVRARTGVGLDEDNLIAVTAYNLNIDIDGVPFEDLRKETDQVFARLLGGAEKIQDSGTTTVAGQKALFYRFPTTSTSKTPVTNETYSVFKGRLQLQLLCQWTPEKKAEMTAGCTSVRESLAFTSGD
jgi:hypothetical protein